MITSSHGQILCVCHDCPAVDACSRYASHSIAVPHQSYFTPQFDSKKTPPCRYFSTWKDEEAK